MPDSKFVPDHRPRMDEAEVRSRYAARVRADHGIRDPEKFLERFPVFAVGVRGYFRDSIGERGKNDLGKMDDAIALVGPGTFRTFNANTDPARAGLNASIEKNFAQLDDGDPSKPETDGQVIVFRQGPHKGRPFHWRQLDDEQAELAGLRELFSDERGDGEFRIKRITRDDVGVVEWGYQAINVHESTAHGTGSAGCQTIYLPQWAEFRSISYQLAALHPDDMEWRPRDGVYGVMPYWITSRHFK